MVTQANDPNFTLVQELTDQLLTNDGLAVTDPVVTPDTLPGIKEAIREANNAGVGKFGVLLVDAPDKDQAQLRDIAQDVADAANYQVIFIRSFTNLELVGDKYPAMQLSMARDEAIDRTVDNQEFVSIIAHELATYEDPTPTWSLALGIIIVLFVALTALWEVKFHPSKSDINHS